MPAPSYIPDAVLREFIVPCLDETAKLKARVAELEQEVASMRKEMCGWLAREDLRVCRLGVSR